MSSRAQLAAVILAGLTTACLEPSGGRPSPDPAATEGEAPTPDATPDTIPTAAPTPGFGLTVEPTLESIQQRLLDPYCVPCHGANDPRAKLDLSDLGRVIDPNAEHDHDGYRGSVIVPSKADESMLVIVMKSSKPGEQMPPRNSGFPSATPQQTEAVRAWIQSLPASSQDDDEPGDDGDGGDDEPGVED